MEKLRIAINARLVPSQTSGGVAQFVQSLVKWLGELDGEEEFVIVTHGEGEDWIRPYLGSNQKLVRAPSPQWRSEVPESAKRWLGPLRPVVRKIYRSLVPLPASLDSAWVSPPISDGFYESLGCDIVHFPYQQYVIVSRPSIYNPIDLQHLHFPHFFSTREIVEREVVYRAGCQFATLVVAGSKWTKRDIMYWYRVHPARIKVIPFSSPLRVLPEPTQLELDQIKAKYQLPECFMYYPAVTWEHKNHIRLIQAIALVRDQNKLKVNLICTGGQTEFWPRIEREIERLRLQDQVKFLGHIPYSEVRAIYRLTQFIIFPSLFEQACGPMYEAWSEGVAIACSNVTSLPQQAQGAALIFDPYSIEQMANAITRMATCSELRESLKQKGKNRLAEFSPTLMAKAYRALYRQVAKRPLTDEDREVLDQTAKKAF